MCSQRLYSVLVAQFDGVVTVALVCTVDRQEIYRLQWRAGHKGHNKQIRREMVKQKIIIGWCLGPAKLHKRSQISHIVWQITIRTDILPPIPRVIKVCVDFTACDIRHVSQHLMLLFCYGSTVDAIWDAHGVVVKLPEARGFLMKLLQFPEILPIIVVSVSVYYKKGGPCPILRSLI